MEKIVAEFESELEEQFSLIVNFDRCPAFSALLDVQELRRIFDNLASNIRKYADPAKPVTLSIRFENKALEIRQTNAVLPGNEQTDSYQIGLNSIRRIAQGYGGSVTVDEGNDRFSISVLFRNL